MVAECMEQSDQRPAQDDPQLIVTRESLLSRLRRPGNESWQEFFETYWKLIYRMARGSGLSDAEAQDVVQETMIGVSRSIPNFVYDPAKCSFKTWLCRLVHWRIVDQIRQRENHEPLSSAEEVKEDEHFEQLWDRDWERNLMQAALDRVKMRANPQEYQIFSFCTLQNKGAAETARVLNLSRARVYLACHRMSREAKKEVARLRQLQQTRTSR
jgi:RNA polymerase sigma-70 factor (ECF subfamily)